MHPSIIWLLPETHQAQANNTQPHWVTLRQDPSGRLDSSKERLESLPRWPRGLVFTELPNVF